MLRPSFYPVADSYLLVVVVALLLAGLLLLGPGRGRVGGWRRATLIGLRAAVVLLIVLAMLRPTLIYTETKKQSATLVILADRSRSMSVQDTVGNKSRYEALRRTIVEAAPALAALAEDFELKAYTFDAQARPAKTAGGKITLGPTPDGEQTAIGAVLEDVLRQEAGKRLLGVVLLSDGAQRAYAPRDLPPQTAASRLKHLGYPLFTFPLGQSRGLGQAKDVAVKDLLVNPSVFEKNDLAVAGQIRADGYAGAQIPVELLFENASGKMEVVAGERLKATAAGQLLPVKLSYAPPTAGEYKLTLRVAEQSGELVTTNNELSTFVNVLKGGLSVLYLEGTPRVEIKFLRRALEASPDINVDFYRIDARRPETRPGNMAEWFQPGKYDVYILGDLDATAFRDNELKDLAEAVDRGAGLIMLGGFHSFAPGGYATTPLAKVLPVTMDRFDRQEFGEKIRSDVHLPGPLAMRPTPVGLLHFALTLAGSREENMAQWAKLPPLTGANRFRALAPSAQTLAVAGRNTPLLVYHYYGRGRVLAFAGDSTWRWWMQGFESAHKRFWRQIVLWLARKDETTEGNVWVRLAKRRFAPAERVEFAAGAQSAGGEVVGTATYRASVVLPDQTRQPLTLVRQGDHMTGSFRQTQAAGDYTIEVTAMQDGAELGTAWSRFLVFQQDLELDNAAADAATLESLAAMTGGESLAPEQFPELIERLAQRTEHLEVEQQIKEALWDTWPFFLLLVALLGTEWYLRKRWGLV
ncbi:MAG: hypothetical protein JXB62_22615 [Pirellulales bacterium]|nr:hypothetical protein [Pirellulales bacterium]